MLRQAIILGSLMFAASVGPAVADAEDIETVRRECGTQLNMPAAICECIAGKAGELTENQQAFLVATVTKDQTSAAALRGQMSIEQMTQVGMFMASAPQACAQGG